MSSLAFESGHPERPLDPEGAQERRLRALSEVAGVVAAAHELDEVLEVAAEATLRVLGVSSLSISRWELDHGRLRTLINVGDLAPEEERWPADETYAVDDFPKAHALLKRGEPHATSLDDPKADPAERQLLRDLGKASCAAAPIVYEGETWGEMYVANAAGAARVTAVDVQFMQTICSQLALALGRAELFSRLVQAAYRDPLTGLANRRAFEERLDAALGRAGGTGLALLLGDVDGLKELNDAAGHAAGDAALRSVGRVLDELGGGRLAARIGGDEFCVVLERATELDAERLAFDLHLRLARADPPVQLSWGVAVVGGSVQTAKDLLSVADARQYEQKCSRRDGAARLAADRRRHREDPVSREDAVWVLELLRDGLELLDASPCAPGPDRAEALDRLVAEQVGLRPDAEGLAAAALELLRREARR